MSENAVTRAIENVITNEFQPHLQKGQQGFEILYFFLIIIKVQLPIISYVHPNVFSPSSCGLSTGEADGSLNCSSEASFQTPVSLEERMAGCLFFSGMACPYDGFVFFGQAKKMNSIIRSLRGNY